jgi:hypothetical protein
LGQKSCGGKSVWSITLRPALPKTQASRSSWTAARKSNSSALFGNLSCIWEFDGRRVEGSVTGAFLDRTGIVAQIRLRPDFRFLRTDLSYGLCSGDAKRCEAIEDRGADLDLSNLPIEVSRREALTEQFHAMHPLPGSRCLQR